MRPFSWVNHAVQALASEGSGHTGIYGKQEVLCIGKNGTYQFVADRLPPISQPPYSEVRSPLSLSAEFNKSAPADIWYDCFEPEGPPPSSTLCFYEPFQDDLNNARMEFDIKLSSWSSTKELGAYTDSESSSTGISEESAKDFSASNRPAEVSATIFQGSATIPITITVTTPADDILDHGGSSAVLETNAPCFPITHAIPEPINNFNPSLLMPPNDNQLDSRKLQKAQEFRKIRKWLISVMNSKGDQFPRKLRNRMMDLYCIREFDLTPEIVAKFNAEVQDEGAALGQDDRMDHAEGLSILGATFRSQIEEVTPLKKIVPLPIPPPWQQRQGSLPKKVEVKKTQPAKLTKIQAQPMVEKKNPAAPTIEKKIPTAPAIETKETEEKTDMEWADEVPSWLGPLISTSTSSRDSIILDRQSLKKAYSTPNLSSSRPHLQSVDSTQSVPIVRSRGNTLAGEDAKADRPTRFKRNSFFSGAIGAMRDAINGKPSQRDGKGKSGR